jgi:carbon monoxide dehydrogenase subunit G
MEHIELEVSIKAPAQKVWDAITNWQAQSDWMLGTKVWPVDGDGTGVGGKIEAFTGIWRIGFLDTMEITSWEPPKRCDVNHTGRVVRGTGTFEVVSTGDSTSKFIWSEDLDLPLGILGKVGFFFVKPGFVFGVRKSLEKFAKQVEQGKL